MDENEIKTNEEAVADENADAEPMADATEVSPMLADAEEATEEKGDDEVEAAA